MKKYEIARERIINLTDEQIIKLCDLMFEESTKPLTQELKKFGVRLQDWNKYISE